MLWYKHPVLGGLSCAGMVFWIAFLPLEGFRCSLQEEVVGVGLYCLGLGPDSGVGVGLRPPVFFGGSFPPT